MSVKFYLNGEQLEVSLADALSAGPAHIPTEAELSIALGLAHRSACALNGCEQSSIGPILWPDRHSIVNLCEEHRPLFVPAALRVTS